MSRREPFKPVVQIRFGVATLSQYAIDLSELTGQHDDEGFRIAIITFDLPPERYEAQAKLFAPREAHLIRGWFAEREDENKYLLKDEGLCDVRGCTAKALWRARWSDIRRSLDLCDDHKDFALSLEQGRKALTVAPLPGNDAAAS